MSETRIRLCAAGDEHLLSLVGGATFLEAFGDSVSGPDMVAHARGPHGVDKYAAWLADAGSRCWIVEIAATASPVGYQLLTAPDLPMETGEGDIELKRIYLFSRWHGGGIARDLMLQAIDAAREMGKTRLLLGVYAENHRAIAFYRRMGFEICGEREFTVGTQTFSDWIMGRSIG